LGTLPPIRNSSAQSYKVSHSLYVISHSLLWDCSEPRRTPTDAKCVCRYCCKSILTIPARNIDSKAHAPRFDCFKFQFHSICSVTFATISANRRQCDPLPAANDRYDKPSSLHLPVTERIASRMTSTTAVGAVTLGV